MERSEPTLVPEWLKNAGCSGSGGSISHTDDHTASTVLRNKSFVNSNGHDSSRYPSSERTTSSYFRRSSSSNSFSNFRSYSSFGRNQRDRDWERDTYDYRKPDKSVKGDRKHREFLDPLGNISEDKFERGALRCLESMASGKYGDTWPERVMADLNDATGKNTNGVVARGTPVEGVNKAAFERDFPSLGAEGRAVTPEVRRVPSPGSNSLPGVGGEKWISALVEVPMLVGSIGANSSFLQQSVPVSSASGASSSNSNLNMAEAVAQGSSRAQATPQRLEELVIKQSRQLIPVTPSMPKTLSLNSSEKQKSKVGLPITHSPHVGPTKGDVPKASPTVGKLHVLKPARDKNGVTPVMDNLSPTSGAKSAGSPLGPARLQPNKPVLTLLEKRPTLQARSRNDFFNLMRKKSMESPESATMEYSPSPVGPDCALSSKFLDKKAEMEVMDKDASEVVEVPPLSLSPGVVYDEKAERCIVDGKKHPSCDRIVSEEEEAAFLRSLGWEEHDEEGGLTDEEISSFYRDLTKYIDSKPSLKILQDVQLKVMLPLDSQIKATDESPDG